MRSFENVDKGNVEELLQCDVCEPGFQHMTDIVSAAAKQNGEEEGGEDESEICAAMRTSLNSSQKQAIITNCFSNEMSVV
jgi:hypothetical protein